MRFLKTLGYLWVLLGAVPLTGCSLVAARVDRSMNTVIPHEPFAVSSVGRELHDSLTVVDLHSDSLLWRRDLLKRNNYGHVDVPRLQEGNVALQVFTIVSKSPKGQNYERNSADSDNITLLTWVNGWPWRTHGSLKERALYQSERLHRFAERSNGELLIVKSRADLRALLKARKSDRRLVGGFLGIEGAQVLEGDLANLAAMYDAGFRYIGLTHFFDNEIGGSAHGIERGGLTDLGRDVVREMEIRGMIVDLAHCSPAVIDDVLAMATRPMIVSHTGVKGTHDSPRNLSDAHVKAIAAKGGVIGIGYWDGAVGEPTLPAIIRAMKYVKDLVGVDHIGLGSDYDGGTNAPFDTSELAVITDGLLKAGFTGEEIRKIMGGNAIELMMKVLPRE